MKRLVILLAMCLLIVFAVGCSEGRADEVLKGPPELKVSVGDRSINPSCGSPEWTVYDEEGNVTSGNIAERVHTLTSYKLGDVDLITTETEAKLIFVVEPDRINVTCWTEENIGQEFPISEKCVLTDDKLTLNKGSYVYQIEAGWEQPLYEGTAYYSFYITVE